MVRKGASNLIRLESFSGDAAIYLSQWENVEENIKLQFQVFEGTGPLLRK
jgi:hypothetical protein